MDRAVRHLAVLDPKTMKYTFVETCYSTHHPQFGYDANDTLWTSGGGPVVGWLNTKMFDETGDAAKSQGWTALVLDTNGNGKRDAYTEPDQPADPTKDRRINSPFYAVMPSPVDGSIWGSTLGYPGAVVRLVAGFESARDGARRGLQRAAARLRRARRRHRQQGRRVGVDGQRPHRQLRSTQVQGAAQRPEGHRRSLSRGLVVLQVSGSRLPGHRRQQRRVELLLLGRSAQHVRPGQRCADVHRQPERRLIAYANGRMVVLRVPYPIGFYAKGFDGRIDDPKAGWKGRGLWAANGDRTPWLIEGGKGTKPLAAHFQLRPDPLAK